MAMQEPLQELLAHLRAAIDAAEDGTGDQEELARLAGEVDRRLNETDSDGVVDDLRHEVTKFEASHPNLASAIGRAADALSALGL
ncbi:MAG: hypothetical protein QOG42_2686 [Solirubrobacteraceae bacterium]|jgi:hypothetical protein|nr:hypothetical protein [Solirubrobacteraceae bacterium]